MGKRAVLAVLVFAFIGMGVSCALPSRSVLIKTYQRDLSFFIGSPEADVSRKVSSSWGFGFLKAWEAEDPKPAELPGSFSAEFAFSPPDLWDVFGAKGAYRVLLFKKLTGEGGLEAQNQINFDVGLQGAIESRTPGDYVYLRISFRNGKLIDYRVW